MKTKLAIYVHIPFCLRKCNYCDFLSAPAAEYEMEGYIRALGQEIKNFARKNEPLLSGYEVCSVFFGGGTPSLLAAGQLMGILGILRGCFCIRGDAEITVECNPGTLTERKLAEYRRAGVNRLSLGLQSANERELRLLGRIHTWEDFLSAYRLARKTGFDNVNVDIMSALPGQTADSYERTLRQVLTLRPEHISAYSLIIEEGTPFYELYGGERQDGVTLCGDDGKKGQEGDSSRCRGGRACCGCGQEKEEVVFPGYGGGAPSGILPAAERLPDEDTERRMYVCTGELLRKEGYQRYEISNYALPGRECRHNICYWERTEYVGFGIGAASLFQGCRLENERDISEYERKIGQGLGACAGRDTLSKRECMEEFMFLGLRMMRGVSREAFFRQFGRDMDVVYGAVLKKYFELGFLGEADGRVFLTERGIDVSNAVFCDFLLDP